jgi:tetratricopeptide (TPR) repeat protein
MDEIAQEESHRISAAINDKDGDRILALFDAGGPARTSPALGCKAAQGLTDLGRHGDAIRVLETLEAQFPTAIRPKQLKALALARRGRSGDLGAAQEILGTLYASGQRDPETLGIYGRTWMDRYAASGDRLDLEQSRDLYAEAFSRAPDDHYTGINAAAKSVLLGSDDDLRRAAEYADQVQALLGTEPKPGDYWATATIGEVFLIRRKYTEAARVYRAAVGMARALEGAHRSTWLQACRLMAQLKPTDAERALVRAAFPHLPDCPGLGVT